MTPHTLSPKHVLLDELAYTYPVVKLKWGHAYGNSQCFATLDAKTDVIKDGGSVRRGLRDSQTQKYFLLQWEIGVADGSGRAFLTETTRMMPACQETTLRCGKVVVTKTFFLPFENHYLRSGHYLLSSSSTGERLVQTRLLFPAGVQVEEKVHNQFRCLVARFADGEAAVLWGSGLRSFRSEKTADETILVTADFEWNDAEFALSFAYAPGTQPPMGIPLVNVFFDSYSTRPIAVLHRERVHLILDQTKDALNRSLETSCFWTPDPLINRAVHWAKINQLRDQQEYKRGVGFSNNPPSDVVVGRDSVWYLAGSNYHAQAWSRQLFDLWFRYGLEVSGKFTEYFSGNSEPLWKDDYGLNINDNTPLFLIVAHQYYSLTGDRGFLDAVYPSLLLSANYILAQRNAQGLIWCTSTETFVRGLCGWRNCIRDYNLSGAVTEVNAECYRSLLAVAELADALGDKSNARRLVDAAADLHEAIERHLRTKPFYLLNINPAGKAVADKTADVLFPALFGLSDRAMSQAILNELFSKRFWADGGNGAGGIRTVSAADPTYQPNADPGSYGLMGGVWPNLALWAAKAAADWGLPDLALKAIRGTMLLSDRDDPARHNVVPGEMPEYFNGDDLVQRGQPRSTFLNGILIWAAVEGFLGLKPRPKGIEVNPALPESWEWVAISKLPYRGCPLTMLAVRKTKTLYTTARVKTKWKQVVVSGALQEKFEFQSDHPAFWLVTEREILAASDQDTRGQLLDRKTNRVVATLTIPAGGLVRKSLSFT